MERQNSDNDLSGLRVWRAWRESLRSVAGRARGRREEFRMWDDVYRSEVIARICPLCYGFIIANSYPDSRVVKKLGLGSVHGAG